MCGVNLLFRESDRKMELMNQATEHRGVRSRSLACCGMTMGHVRLPIQDTSEASDQPMLMHDGNRVMFVGEMFNFREKDPDARTDLPTLYHLATKRELDEVDGFWAKIVVNPRRREVKVSTDPLGKKQLYMRIDGVRAISSEIGPLLILGPVTPDDLFYSMVAKWGYCAYDRTPFREIVKLHHGSEYWFDRFGDLVHPPVENRIDPQEGDLYDLLRTAVGNRTVSDVPISMLLSGGLDSTIVFELLKETGVPFTAYHIDNDESEFLEHLSFPDRVTVRKLSMGSDVGRKELRRILVANESPVDLGSMVQQYRMAQAVAEDGVHVTLSGDGADELFGGYGRAQVYDSQHSDVFCELPYYHLPRLDRLMMRHTVELRCPFLSIPVVRHALSLPWGERTCKQHLKRVFARIVPEPILLREKKALKSPMHLQDEQRWRSWLIRMHRRIYFE